MMMVMMMMMMMMMIFRHRLPVGPGELRHAGLPARRHEVHPVTIDDNEEEEDKSIRWGRNGPSRADLRDHISLSTINRLNRRFIVIDQCIRPSIEIETE
jgi:hypothetical protein